MADWRLIRAPRRIQRACGGVGVNEGASTSVGEVLSLEKCSIENVTDLW